MLHRTALSVGAALALAACPKATPATGPINNATVAAGAGACPDLDVDAVGPEDGCVRGEFAPALDAPAAAPSCHQVAQSSPISGFEQVVLGDHGAVRLEHGGCAHWSLVIRFAASPGAAAGAADVYRYAARVLRALPARADDTHLAALAAALDGAATAAVPPSTRIELGQPITITDGFEYVTVSVEGDQIVVIDDVAL